MTRQQKIEAIGRDFLDRDQDAYVRIRRTGRLGWESLIPQGGNYSDLLRDTRSEGDIIREAYGMARDYIVAMDTPFRVTLRLSPEANCTDSKVVYLATRVFDDSDLSDGQKIDTFVGLAIHEGCHLKWTDFSQMASEDNAIIRNLINLLEDERIERECGETMPGYANYLKATKYYMFDLYARKMAEQNKGQALPEPVRLLNAILALIRYPKALKQEDVEEFTDELYAVRELLLQYPSTPAEVTATSKAIYEIIKHWFEKKNMPPQEGGQGEESEKTDEGDSSESEKKGKSSGEESGEQQDGQSSSGQDGEKEEGESGESSGDGTGQEDSESLEEKVKKALSNLSDEQKEELRQAVEQALSDLESEAETLSELTSDPSDGTSPMDADDIADCVRRDDCQLAGICENMVTLGETPHSVLYKAPEDKLGYEDSLRRVRKYIPAIAKTMKNQCSEYRFTYHGMRSGLLDTSKLAEAYQGVQTVYTREGKVKSDRMAVCVLIDESGSMYGDKIRAARDLAVLLSEAVSTIPAIDLYVYGHTYGDRCRDSYHDGEKITELQIYREKGYAPKKALGSVEARSGNLDSFAIRESAARMKRFSSCRKNLMFVITDGAPNERYDQLTQTVKNLEKEGMNIVAVCIEPGYDPSALYTHSVTLTDMSTLALNLGKMIKKAIMKSSNRHEE